MGSGANLGPRQKATEDGALAWLANLMSPGEEQVGRELVGNMPSDLLGDTLPGCCTPILRGPQPGGPEKRLLLLGTPLCSQTVPKPFTWLGQRAIWSSG